MTNLATRRHGASSQAGTAGSLRIHLGNAWFGGMLPASMFLMNAGNGNIYHGLWFLGLVIAGSLITALLFFPATDAGARTRQPTGNARLAGQLAPGD